MKAILKEEKKIEDFKNQSYDIEKLGIAGEIFCTKSLVISTGLQKGKVKALLQAAKEVENVIENDIKNDIYTLFVCTCEHLSTDYYVLVRVIFFNCVRSLLFFF